MKHLTLALCLIAIGALCSRAFADNEIDGNQRRKRAVALYNNADHATKCSAVFEQMRTKLKAGMTSTEVSGILRDVKWLDHSQARWITILAGWIPVDMGPGHKRAFSMELYPNVDGWSNYSVYFSISCPEELRKDFTINEFLEGKVLNGAVRLHQFALCHPRKTFDDISRRYEVIPKKESEQGGAGQSSTRSEPKSDSNENANPKSEGR